MQKKPGVFVWYVKNIAVVLAVLLSFQTTIVGCSVSTEEDVAIDQSPLSLEVAELLEAKFHEALEKTIPELIEDIKETLGDWSQQGQLTTAATRGCRESRARNCALAATDSRFKFGDGLCEGDSNGYCANGGPYMQYLESTRPNLATLVQEMNGFFPRLSQHLRQWWGATPEFMTDPQLVANVSYDQMQGSGGMGRWVIPGLLAGAAVVLVAVLLVHSLSDEHVTTAFQASIVPTPDNYTQQVAEAKSRPIPDTEDGVSEEATQIEARADQMLEETRQLVEEEKAIRQALNDIYGRYNPDDGLLAESDLTPEDQAATAALRGQLEQIKQRLTALAHEAAVAEIRATLLDQKAQTLASSDDAGIVWETLRAHDVARNAKDWITRALEGFFR